MNSEGTARSSKQAEPNKTEVRALTNANCKMRQIGSPFQSPIARPPLPFPPPLSSYRRHSPCTRRARPRQQQLAPRAIPPPSRLSLPDALPHPPSPTPSNPLLHPTRRRRPPQGSSSSALEYRSVPRTPAAACRHPQAAAGRSRPRRPRRSRRVSGWCSGGGQRCRWRWRTSGAAATPAPRPTSPTRLKPEPGSGRKGPFYYEDLEDMMFDSMSESFHTDCEDGSVGEVAEHLLTMHEECQQGNFSSIEKLRNTHPQGNAVSQSRQVANEDDDDSSDDDDESSMGGDEAARSEDMAVDEPKPSKPTPDADGWTTVPPRRGRGKN